MVRRHFRGGVAVVVVVVVALLAVAAGAYYWIALRGFGFGATAFDLAAHLPKTARIAWMVNLRGQIDPRVVGAELKNVLSHVPDEERTRFLERWSEDVGISFDEAAKLFDGRMAGALIQHADSGVGMLALVGLRDAKGFDAFMQQKSDRKQGDTVQGVTFYPLSPEGASYGHDGTWAYFVDSKATAEVVMTTASGTDTLAKEASFIEAKGKVTESGSLAALYFDIAGTIKSLEGSELPYSDAQTLKELGCLSYAVLNLDLKSQHTNAYLKISNPESALAQKLLAQGSVTPATFEALAKTATSCYALDAEWTFNTVVALMMLSPDTRQAAGMASLGLAVYGNPFVAFEGEVAVTTDALELAGPSFAENFVRARALGQLTACKSNLKNIATGLEMYSTDFEGKYPDSLAKLSPDYLKVVPDCPAAGSDTYSGSYKVSTSPDTYAFACSGNHHRQPAENLPAYNSEEGLSETFPLGSSEELQRAPSAVFTALVKDANMAHALLAKGLGEGAGPEPKSGEDKVYPAPPGATLSMKMTPPERLVATMGDNASVLADLKNGTMADNSQLKDALAWAGDGVIYADYLNLSPLVQSLAEAIPADKTPENDTARAVVEKLKNWDLQGASCLVARPDGLQWRSFGNSGGMVAVGGVGAAILVPNFIRARSQGQLSACKSNLKNLGTAMEMYATDNSGKYPDDMAKLTPEYLRDIPECPAAGRVSYALYTGLKAPGNESNSEDYYYFECQGENHAGHGLAENFPAYSALMGLLESEP